MPKYKLRRALYKNARKNTLISLNAIRDSTCAIESLENYNIQHSHGVNTENMDDHEGLDSDIETDDNISYISKTDSNNNVELLCDNTGNNSDNNDNININRSLAEWACTFHIPHNALNALLSTVLKNIHPDIPSDSRTLLKTPRDLCVREMYPGHYFHFGVTRALNNLLNTLGTTIYSTLACLELTINIDGLPLYKSSSKQLYPILCSLYKYSPVEVIGLYLGPEKPKDVNIFLKQFVDEAVNLINNGFSFNSMHYSFRIVAFVCDVPAKSYITCIKGHTGYYSCSKCHIEGTFLNNTVCFPQIKNLVQRNDNEFREKLDIEHHTGTSCIELLPYFDMILNIPLDYMHLICLGVMRKLLMLWLTGKPPNKLSHKKISELSILLTDTAKYIPVEFARKPRSLDELKRFKATEFRQFLCYTGPVVLRNILSKNMYVNFLCLHVATTILCNSHLLEKYIGYANKLLQYFVMTFTSIYGKQNVSHNVHNLLHICEDAMKFGVLQNFSAFPFENYLQKLKKLVRKGDKPLTQIVKRLLENQIQNTIVNQEYSKDEVIPKYSHNNGPLMFNEKCNHQYKQIHHFKNFVLKTKEPDNCCSLYNQSIVSVENIIEMNGELFIIGREFTSVQSFFDVPCESSCINIFEVSCLSNLKKWNIKEVAFKNIKIICHSKSVVLPLLHCEN